LYVFEDQSFDVKLDNFGNVRFISGIDGYKELWLYLVNSNKEVFLSYLKCKEVLLNIGWESRGDFKESILSKTQRRLNDFSEWLNNQYQHKHYSEIRKWIYQVSTYTKEKLSNRFIFTEFYNMNYFEFINSMNMIIKDIGIPLIFNNKQECACLLPKGYEPEPFTQFYVMLKFLSYMSSEEDKCPLIDFCNSNYESKSQPKCYTNPLSFVKEEELCPLALFMKSFGFHQVDFKKEKL
jgi:hypothetical protein